MNSSLNYHSEAETLFPSLINRNDRNSNNNCNERDQETIIPMSLGGTVIILIR